MKGEVFVQKLFSIFSIKKEEIKSEIRIRHAAFTQSIIGIDRGGLSDEFC